MGAATPSTALSATLSTQAFTTPSSSSLSTSRPTMRATICRARGEASARLVALRDIGGGSERPRREGPQDREGMGGQVSGEPWRPRGGRWRRGPRPPRPPGRRRRLFFCARPRSFPRPPPARAAPDGGAGEAKELEEGEGAEGPRGPPR